jgi:hypothetical protein
MSVTDKGHHDFQTLKFGRAYKRIPAPLPLFGSFPTLRSRLKADVIECSFPGMVTLGAR